MSAHASATKSEREVRYRIDELAQAAHTTVRNLRAYQDRGILPPPTRDGRVGYYSQAHLARVRTITTLLERGYSLGNIAELLQAWERGGNLEELLGLEMAVVSPFDDDTKAPTSLTKLAKLFGTLDFSLLARAKEVGLLEAEGAELFAPSPKLLQAGAALSRAGIPLAALLEELGTLREELDVVAERFVEMVIHNVFDSYGDGLPPKEAHGRLTDTIWKVRPFAASVVQIVLEQALERRMREAFGRRLSKAVEPTSKEGDDAAPKVKHAARAKSKRAPR